MSETVRSYTRVSPRTYRSPGRSRGGKWIVLLFLIAIIGGFLAWFTRDSHPIAHFFPRGQRLGAVINNPIECRDRIVASPLWSALPEDARLAQLPELLMQNFGMPEWVLNNLVRERIYVTANDLDDFSDVICISRMTRLGALFERSFRLVGWVDYDSSGGLALRRLPEEGIYYAVRGRVLVASPSRDTLIEALTLPEASAITETDLAALGQPGPEDVQGIYVLDTESLMGRNFAHVGFAVKVVADETRLDLRAVPHDGAPRLFRELINDASPRELAEPPPGLAALSLDFGRPASAVWKAALAAAGQGGWPSQIDDMMTEAEVSNWEAVRDLLVNLTGDQGPGVRVALAGIETDEFIPMPELAFTFDADRGEIAKRLADVSTLAPVGETWAMWPRYEAAIQRLYIPMAGGPALEPTAGLYGNGLLVATSRRVGDDLLGRAYERRPAKKTGNLYLRLNPQAFVEQCVEAGRLLAEDGLLRGYNTETFDDRAARWQRAAAAVESTWGIARAESGTVTAEIHVVSRSGS